MSSRNVKDLKEPFQSSIQLLIKKAEEEGLNPLVTDVSRTLAEQRQLKKDGLSFTLDSKHLIGEAVDIAFTYFPNGKGGLLYDAKLYKRLYAIIKDIPFVIWPYKDLGWGWDKPHFQYDKTKKIGDNGNMKLSDFKVDGMPADQRIAALKGQVKRYKSEINRWRTERFKWFDIAKERLGLLHKLNITNEVCLGTVDDLKDDLEDAEDEVERLTEQLKDCGLTPEQEEGLSLLERFKKWLP